MKPIINPWLFDIVDCLEGLKIVCICAVPVLVVVIEGVLQVILPETPPVSKDIFAEV